MGTAKVGGSAGSIPSRGPTVLAVAAVVLASLVTAIVMGYIFTRLGLMFAILLAGCAYAIHVGASRDRDRALREAQMPPPPGLRALQTTTRETVPRPIQNLEKVLSDAESVRCRARIPAAARRPGGQRADALFVPVGRFVTGCWAIALLCAAATVWVGVVHRTATALMILVTVGLVTLALSVSYRVSSCSPAAIYDRSRPGKGAVLRFEDIDAIGLVVGNQPQPIGLIVRAGERRVVIPRQSLTQAAWQPVIARLLRCEAQTSLAAYSTMTDSIEQTDHGGGHTV